MRANKALRAWRERKGTVGGWLSIIAHEDLTREGRSHQAASGVSSLAKLYGATAERKRDVPLHLLDRAPNIIH